MDQSEDQGGRPLVPRVPTGPGSPLCLAFAALSCREITGTNNPLPVSGNFVLVDNKDWAEKPNTNPKTCWRTERVGRGRGAAELDGAADPAPDLSCNLSLGTSRAQHTQRPGAKDAGPVSMFKAEMSRN